MSVFHGRKMKVNKGIDLTQVLTAVKASCGKEQPL